MENLSEKEINNEPENSSMPHEEPKTNAPALEDNDEKTPISDHLKDDVMARVEDSEAPKQKQKKKRRSIIILVLLVILIAIILNAFFTIRDLFESIYTPVDTIDLRDVEEPVALGNDPFSLLIIGNDRYGDGRLRERYHPGEGYLEVYDDEFPGSADVVMLVTVNPTENTTYVLSIPRDVRLNIFGYGVEDRLTSAYFWGGSSVLINTIQQFLNIPIDFYIELEKLGFMSLIDAIGGISLYNDHLEFGLGGYNFPLGELELTGSQAMNYVRMRSDDPNDDLGRQLRQRDVIGALVNELISPTAITHHQDIFAIVATYVTTDLRFSEMVSVATDYNVALSNIVNLYLTGSYRSVDGLRYIVISASERNQISNRLREHLELDALELEEELDDVD